jgi:microcin C transport system substrate-binding protein
MRKHHSITILVFLTFLLSGVSLTLLSAQTTISHALALHGEPKYGADFSYFDYVNPGAPKGGNMTLHAIGTFDNFHRYALRGIAAAASAELYDSLMVGSEDEAGVIYPLIAEKIEYPDDFSYVIFHINRAARFQDGTPITADDAVFSFNTFMEKGVPQWRQYFAAVTEVKALDRYRVRFSLASGDREMVVSLGGLKIIPQKWWSTRDFSEPQNEVPLGSGVYTVDDYRMGQYVVYKRLENYWARDLPVNRGRYNFDTIRYDYYRDDNVAFEAFKAGEYDFRIESVAKNWATLYTGGPFDRGHIAVETIEHQQPAGMQAFVFNTQKPIFQDRRVREAIGYLFDFEWMNRNLFYNQYTRTRSYFQNTMYEAKGLPSAGERAILDPVRSKVPPEVFTKEYQPPTSDGSGNIRGELRAALALFRQAGWEIQNRRMVNVKSGEEMKFELLLYSPTFERVAIPFQQNLERAGITLNIRVVDTTQFTNRLRERDFDMINSSYSANIYPDSSLQIAWHSDFIDHTYNTAGVADEAVDYLVEGILARQEKIDELLHWGRALDRVLTWNHYVVPHWHLSAYRTAYWNKYSRPAQLPKYGFGLSTWWWDSSKAASLPRERR